MVSGSFCNSFGFYRPYSEGEPATPVWTAQITEYRQDTAVRTLLASPLTVHALRLYISSLGIVFGPQATFALVVHRQRPRSIKPDPTWQGNSSAARGRPRLRLMRKLQSYCDGGG